MMTKIKSALGIPPLLYVVALLCVFSGGCQKSPPKVDRVTEFLRKESSPGFEVSVKDCRFSSMRQLNGTDLPEGSFRADLIVTVRVTEPRYHTIPARGISADLFEPKTDEGKAWQRMVEQFLAISFTVPPKFQAILPKIPAALEQTVATGFSEELPSTLLCEYGPNDSWKYSYIAPSPMQVAVSKKNGDPKSAFTGFAVVLGSPEAKEQSSALSAAITKWTNYREKLATIKSRIQPIRDAASARAKQAFDEATEKDVASHQRKIIQIREEMQADYDRIFKKWADSGGSFSQIVDRDKMVAESRSKYADLINKEEALIRYPNMLQFENDAAQSAEIEIQKLFVDAGIEQPN